VVYRYALTGPLLIPAPVSAVRDELLLGFALVETAAIVADDKGSVSIRATVSCRRLPSGGASNVLLLGVEQSTASLGASAQPVSRASG
jgi:hypothetical protein